LIFMIARNILDALLYIMAKKKPKDRWVLGENLLEELRSLDILYIFIDILKELTAVNTEDLIDTLKVAAGDLDLIPITVDGCVWMAPRDVGREVAELCAHLDIETSVKHRILSIITDGMLYKDMILMRKFHAIDPHSYFILKLSEKFDVADHVPITFTAEYRGWSVSFDHAYIVPIRKEVFEKNILIFEGSATRGELTVPLCVHSTSSLESKEEIITAFLSDVFDRMSEVLADVHDAKSRKFSIIPYLLTSSDIRAVHKAFDWRAEFSPGPIMIVVSMLPLPTSWAHHVELASTVFQMCRCYIEAAELRQDSTCSIHAFIIPPLPGDVSETVAEAIFFYMLGSEGRFSSEFKKFTQALWKKILAVGDVDAMTILNFLKLTSALEQT